MKSIEFILLICLLSIDIYAQDVQSNITTPLGDSVDAWIIDDELSTTARSALDNNVAQTRPNVVMYATYDGYSSTNMFNCHAYAWYMSQKSPMLTNPRWIGYYSGNTDEHVYWEKGSYIEVTNETYPGMVSWSDGDHSAITTSTPGKWKSKWSYAPLCLHDWDDTPFEPLVFKYYAPFKVNGSQLLCSGNTATFTTPDYVNCTFNWTWDTNLLDTVSGQGTKTFVVEPKNSYSQGNAWVKLTLNIDAPVNKTRVISKDVWVGKVDGDKIVSSREGQAVGAWAQYRLLCDEGITEVVAGYDSNGDGEMVGDAGYLSYRSITGYEWNFPSGWSYYDTYEGITNEYIDVSPDGSTYPQPGQMVQVGIRAQNGCGWSNWKYDYWQVISCGGGWYMSVSPNPSNGMVTVSINNKSKTYNSRIDENITWVLDVYNINQPRLKERITKLQGSSTTINTSGWEKGIYIVQARYKDKVLQAKLVVE